MPYKFQTKKIKLPKGKDRRYKFSILNMEKTKKKEIKRSLFVSLMYLLIIVQALTVVFLTITIFLDLFYI